MVVVACVINNITRRYPIYWWAPTHTGQIYRTEQIEGIAKDVEKVDDEDARIERSGRELITLDANKIVIPGWMALDVEEKAVLEALRSRLEQDLATTRSRGSDATYVAEHDASRDLR